MMRRLTGFVVCTAVAWLAGAVPAAGQMPTATGVLARHAEALGGAELSKVTSLKLTGSFNFNGVDSPYTVYRQRPNRYRMEIETASGTVMTGFDGETAWSQRPNRSGAIEVREMEGEDRQRFLDENADFDGPLVDCEAKGHIVEMVGEADVDGVAAYHLKLSLKSGNVQQWFLSKHDYQAVRKITPAVHRRSGPYDRVWYLMEYEQTDGVTLPFYIEREDRQHVRAYTVEKVEVGVEIDPGLFAMPVATPNG